MSEAAATRDRTARRTTNEVSAPRQVLTLTLRAVQPDEAELEHRRRRVSWHSGVQEPQFQRVSKCCCVFHRKRLFGESDSSSSSSSSGDEAGDDGIPAAGPAPGNSSLPNTLDNDHSHDPAGQCCGHSHGHAQNSTQPSTDDPTKLIVKRKKSNRPKCTKEHCYCGTRFS